MVSADGVVALVTRPVTVPAPGLLPLTLFQARPPRPAEASADAVVRDDAVPPRPAPAVDPDPSSVPIRFHPILSMLRLSRKQRCPTR